MSKSTRGLAPTTYDLHLRLVIKDVEFQQKLSDIKNIYASKYRVLIPDDLPRLSRLYAETEDLYVHLVKDVGTSEQRLFLKWDDFADKPIRDSIITLSEDYALDTFWIVESINSPLSVSQFFNGRILRNRALVEEDDKSLFIRIWANTQIDDIEAVWDEIEAAKRATYFEVSRGGKWTRYEKTSNKAPEHPELIYAIFRARREGLSFQQIYDLYAERKLPRFSGKPIFTGYKSIETYYNKYRPTT